jgi:hypothetical protein
MPDKEYSEHERIPMQHLIIDAAQDPTFAHKKIYGGATVACWIKNQTRKNAGLIAKGWVEDNGWVVLSLDEQHPISEADYEKKQDGKQHFEQALTDDEVFVFYTFPEHERR